LATYCDHHPFKEGSQDDVWTRSFNSIIWLMQSLSLIALALVKALDEPLDYSIFKYMGILRVLFKTFLYSTQDYLRTHFK